MELQLKNIGMIKEANVKIDGLTVIAGENDTGKSTVGKALYIILNSLPRTDLSEQKLIPSTGLQFSGYIYSSKVFRNSNFNKDYLINLIINNNEYPFEEKIHPINLDYLKKNQHEILFIETPLVWNLSKFFRDIALVESQMNIEVDYPFFMKNLNFKLFIKSKLNGIDIKDKMISLMGGEFEQDERGDFFFNKNGKRIELENTSTGIKQFGIFQVLSQNNYLNKNTILVLDEPEVHLHPKWQLEMAKIIVELVKNGVKIVVNSHSPYMIEALKRYSEVGEIEDKTNFYLAEDGYIKYQESLEGIFEKLAEPMRELKELKWQSLKKN